MDKMDYLRVVQTQAISFFKVNVGMSRIRHKTTLNLNDVIFNRFWVDKEIWVAIQNPVPFYIGSDSDNDFKNRLGMDYP